MSQVMTGIRHGKKKLPSLDMIQWHD